jgi:hypothetical protein
MRIYTCAYLSVPAIVRVWNCPCALLLRALLWQCGFVCAELSWALLSSALLSWNHKEHIQTIRNNNSKSGYSNHILSTGHTYGTITNTMKIVKTGKKGRHLNTLEKYRIYRISKDNLNMNDTYITYTTPYLKHWVNSTPDSSKFPTTPPSSPFLPS